MAPVSAENFFALTAVTFGLLLALLTAPFQSPDEAAHFLRIYQLSEGQVRPIHYGGQVPISLGECFNQFEYLKFHSERKTTPGAVMKEFHRPLQPERCQFLQFPNTAIYSPVPYLPQVVAVYLGRGFSLPPIALMYLGRCANVLSYAAMGWLVVRTLPILKWPASLILLSPLPIFLAGSLSADPLTTDFAFLLTAFALRAMDGELSAKSIAMLAAAVIGTSLCKWTYLPAVILITTVPTRAWGQGRWLIPGSIILCGMAAFTLWLRISNPTNVPLRNGDPLPQIRWIESHPVLYCRVIVRTICIDSRNILGTSIGVLGWLDIRLSRAFIAVYMLFTLWAVINDPGSISLSGITRLLAAAAVVFSSLLIATCIYLVWDGTGRTSIEGLQGRYFIPLTLLGFTSIRRCRRLQIPPLAIGAVIVGSCLYTVTAVFLRYY